MSDYNTLIHKTLSVLEISLIGEITELNIWQNKYSYVTLKDINVQDVTTTAFGICTNLQPNLSTIKIGDIVCIEGYPGIHLKTGRHSLNISYIKKVEEGTYEKKRNDLIEKLTSEGIVSPSRKRSIKRIANRLALITAVPSQAYNDFIKIYNSRWGQGTIDVYKAKMQGVDTDKLVALAIDEIYRSNIKYDCIVMTRGGGSKEDLISFDSEILAYKIFGSKFPVISAIGHEGDISIADMVSDVRASTPSNAAEIVTTPDKNYILKNSDHIFMEIYEKVNSSLDKLSDINLQIFGDISDTINNNMNKIEEYLDYKNKILEAYDLQKTLERGFSIISGSDDIPINAHDKLISGDLFNIYLKDGKEKYKVKKEN
ncbi:MAG: exodeoxyribonuclease VII large subunit [bacterium]